MSAAGWKLWRVPFVATDRRRPRANRRRSGVARNERRFRLHVVVPALKSSKDEVQAPDVADGPRTPPAWVAPEAAERSDEALMMAYVDGDALAFAELFHRYTPRLRRVLLWQVPVRAEVDDLIQQTFLQLHRARRDFDSAHSFRPWLFTIAFNLKREQLRKRKRRPEVALDASAPEPRTDSGEGRSHAALALDLALVRLPVEQREVIVLHWFGGLSFAEVASAVGASTAAVKVRAHRGYLALRRLIDEPGALEPRPGNPKPAPGILALSTPERGQRGLRRDS